MGEPALRAEGVTVARDGRVVLRDVSLEVEHGEVLALLGPNGAGKSTLLRALLGLVPHEGEVLLEGGALAELDARARARAVAYVPQHGLLATAFSVEDVVLQGRYAHAGGASTRDLEVTADALRVARVEHLRRRPFTELSHGERRRVLLARALATEARVILLDEPDAFLDVGQALALFELLRALSASGYAIVVVLHGLDVAARVADRALLLDHGREVASGTPAAVLTEENLARVYGVRPASSLGAPFELVERERPPEPAARPADATAGPVSRGRALGALNLGAALLALCLGALGVGARRLDTEPVREREGAPVSVVVDRTGARFSPRDYRRIVSASVTADQLLAELVDPGRVLAVSSYGKRREPVSYRFEAKAVIDDLNDVERIVALEPDLVLVHDFTRADVAARLREAGVPVFDFGEMGGAARFAEDARTLGRLLGVEARADAFAERYLARLEGIAADLPREGRASALYARVIGGSIYGGGEGTSYHDVIVHGGLRDAAEGRFTGWPSLDPETLLSIDPDHLVMPEGNGAALCGRDGLRVLRACREGGVLELPGGLLDDAGLGIEAAARALRRALVR